MPDDAPCADAEHRQFDFWIGEWEVFDPDGVKQGTNRIESILGGCALYESWTGETGSVGHSLNTYDGRTGRWHQTWVDSNGLLLQLHGGLEDGAMVLAGAGIDREGDPIRHRISWTPLEDGRVRQHWEVARNGEWQDVFVGLYVKV